MDLLTVLPHEAVHLLGHEHEPDGLMAETLTAGTRQAPRSGASRAALAAPLSSTNGPTQAVSRIELAPTGRRKKGRASPGRFGAGTDYLCYPEPAPAASPSPAVPGAPAIATVTAGSTSSTMRGTACTACGS